MSIEDFFNKTGYFYKATAGAPPATIDKTWTLYDNFPVAKQNLSGNSRVVDYAKNILADIRVYVKDFAIVGGDRVKIEDKVYELYPGDNPMERGHHKEFKGKWLSNEKTGDWPEV